MKHIIIIGAGPAGMAAAGALRGRARVTVVERAEAVGGKLRDWHHLFPTSTPAHEVLDELKRGLDGAEVRLGAEATAVSPHEVRLSTGEILKADAVIATNGFEIFDARLKEEYGYGVYEHVYTTADVERMLREDRFPITPRRIAFVHCVGSRDEKVGQRHCSKVCCVTAVKQAMEMRERFAEADIFNFYMDIRMFGPGYEELYQQAQQESRVNFIRGRVSEASPTFDGRIQIKAEDTLVGRPMKMTVDMLILVVGMRGEAIAGLPIAPNGFVVPRNMFGGCVQADTSCVQVDTSTAKTSKSRAQMSNTHAPIEAACVQADTSCVQVDTSTAAVSKDSAAADSKTVFVAGAATAPKTVGESIAEGVMAAQKVLEAL